ncbi:MAG: hypothetical protein ACD_28C00327G0010 [uncultured bacterium]|nr:MAG: hypothetical protein ACD_28C00327G0010 [uncultured bacterium]KKT75468.1 MAG: hypothetical protein UW70_C0034G0015 [Candidatus Peregrinibacteria bacterium GW2011_GWA2_44_7]
MNSEKSDSVDPSETAELAFQSEAVAAWEDLDPSQSVPGKLAWLKNLPSTTDKGELRARMETAQLDLQNPYF